MRSTEDIDLVLDEVDTDEKEVLVDTIRARLACNKRIKVDPKERYPELDQLSVRELKTCLFNMQQDEGAANNTGVATFMLRSLGAIIEGYTALNGVADAIAGDQDLVDNISSELTKYTLIPNYCIAVIRIGNHLYEGLQRQARRMGGDPKKVLGGAGDERK